MARQKFSDNQKTPAVSFAQPKSFAPGSKIGEYEIVDELGRGGMGVVYKARQASSDRLVALKILLAGQAADISQTQRFAREFKATAMLRHANIVEVYAHGDEAGYPYFAMQYVQGRTFEHALRQPDFALPQKLAVLVKICRALAHAHRHKVIHRDLKPSNILLDRQDEPFLSDFGLAKIVDSKSHLTHTGNALGTPFYMAPEQLFSEKTRADARSDIYSMGVILYQAMTGQLPFVAETLPALCCRVAQDEPEFPVDAGRPLQAICRKAMEKKATLRYASADDLADDIERFLAGKRVAAQKFAWRAAFGTAARAYRRRPLRISLAIVAVLTAIFLPALHLWQYHQHKTNVAAQAKSLRQAIETACRESSHKAQQGRTQESCLYLQHALQLVQNDQRKGQTAVLPESELAELTTSLHQRLVQAYWRAGLYHPCYEQGISLLSNPALGEEQRQSLSGTVGKAAYHCELFAEAQQYLAALDQWYQSHPQLTPEQSANHLQVCHYLGLAWWRQESVAQAQQYFVRALAMSERQPVDAGFAQSLGLHYCACLLNELEQKLTPELASAIDKYLPPCDESSAFSMEVHARYLIQKAQRDPAVTRQLAERAISLANDCLRLGSEKAELYYLRGYAHRLLDEYTQARGDFATASQIRAGESRFSYLGAQLQISNWAEPDSMISQYIDFVQDVDQNVTTRPNLFAAEFARLRRYCLAQQTASVHGTPFVESHVEEMCKLLDADNALRQLAESSLCSVVPAAQVMRVLQHKMQAAKGAQRASLVALCARIEQAEQRRQQRTFINALSQVPPYARITDLSHFHHAQGHQFLQSIIADESQPVMLRFLAARVLVRMPVPGLREKLWSDHLVFAANPVVFAVVLHAFQEILLFRDVLGADTWDKIVQKLPTPMPEASCWPFTNRQGELIASEQNDFFHALLAEVMPCDNKKLSAIWQWLLQNGSQRTRVIAASRFATLQDIDFAPQVIAALRQGLFSSLPEIQAWSLISLGNNLNSTLSAVSKEWLDTVSQHFWDEACYQQLRRLTAESNPQLQKSVLYFWRCAALLFIGHTQRLQTVQEAIKPFWSSPDPAVRSHALMTSAGLQDDTVYDFAFFRQPGSTQEKLGIVMGGVRQRDESKKKYEDKKVFDIMVSLLTNPKEQPHLRGALLCLGGAALQFKKVAVANNKDSSVPHKIAMLEYMLSGFFKHSDADLVMWALVSSSFFQQLSDKNLAFIEKLKNEHPQLQVRAMATAVLLNYAVIKQQPQRLRQLHQWYKQLPAAERRQFYPLVVWGYGSPIMATVSPNISAYEKGLDMGWREECIREFKVGELLAATKRNNNVAEYILRLENILDILSPDHREFVTYTHWLALLLHRSGQSERVLQLLATNMALAGERGFALWLPWSQIQLAQGRHDKVMEILQAKLMAMDRWTIGDLQSDRRRCEEKAIISLCLSMAYRAAASTRPGQPDAGLLTRSLELAHQAFFLQPASPLVCQNVGECHLQRREYESAFFIFSGVIATAAKNADLYVGHARAAAALQKWPEIHKALRKASGHTDIQCPIPRSLYPEFANLPPDVVEENKQFFTDK